MAEAFEGMRQQFSVENRTYETQLQKELSGFADGLQRCWSDWEFRSRAGQLTAGDVLAMIGPGLYERYWTTLRNKPVGRAGLLSFFRSPFFTDLPMNKISSQLFADLLTGNEPVRHGDPMDVHLLSVAIPVAHFVLTDKRMERRVVRRAIDKDFDTKVFSMKTLDVLLAELEALM